MMQIAGERGLCRLVIINRIDAEGLELERLLEEIRTTLGSECLALNLPARRGTGVADCFFAPAGEADFSSVEAAHDALVDQVVEVDEELMALYLEQG
jgi:elongation factor G